MSANSYRVCVVVPAGYAHSHAFLEVAMLLKSSIADNGYACDLALNEVCPERINILLGYHLIPMSDDLKRVRYIPYQLEQLSDSPRVYSERIAEVLRNAHDIWDYSQENVAFLAARGIPAHHIPLGYHPALERIHHLRHKDIDVFFYGSGGERRCSILDQLAADPSVTLQTGFGVYTEKRDQIIARSRMVLNIHALETKIFEAVRVSYLLNNRVFVVSEESSCYPYPHVPLPRIPYENLVDTCLEYIRKPAMMVDIAESCYTSFKDAYPMTEILSRALA